MSLPGRLIGIPRQRRHAGPRGGGAMTRSEQNGRASVRLVSLVTARVLRYVGSNPGTGTIDVRHDAHLSHRTQAWKVLTQLERDGMVASHRHGNARAWTPTPHGNAVLANFPQAVYA